MVSILKAAVAALTVIVLAGCSTVTITERNARLVTATSAKAGEGVKGIKDTFTLEERVFVHSTFTWDDTSARGGYKALEARWFSGEKLIMVHKANMTFGPPPHYAWDSIQAIALGLGKARVDVYVDGLFVGSKDFFITQASTKK